MNKVVVYFSLKLPHSLYGDANQKVGLHGSCCHMKHLPHKQSAATGKKTYHGEKMCKQGRSTHTFLHYELEFTVRSKILPQDFVVEVTIPYFAGHTIMHDCFVGRHVHMLVDVVNPTCNYIHRHFIEWPHGLGKITQVDVRRFALNDLGSVQT